MKPLALDRIVELLDRARDVCILVVGDVMLDRYVTGRVARISPEAPVPVVRVEEGSSAVGGAANVAANVVALGARCRVVGCVGDDEAGKELRDALGDLGVDSEGLVATPRRPTTVKTRVMARHQQVVRIDREQTGDVDRETGARLAAAAGALMADCAAVTIEDYNKGVLVPSVVGAVLNSARRRGIPSIVDPKRQRFFEYRGVTLFKPNSKELEDALGEPPRPTDARWMEAVRNRLGCRHLLLTLGEEGMALHSEGGDSVLLPTSARSVYDVSGAGDTVAAAVSVALAAGASALEAAALANHAAALEVAKAGVATVSPSEIVGHAEEVLSA